MWIYVIIGYGFGWFDFWDVVIQILVFVLCDIGVMWMGKVDGQVLWLVIFVVCQIVKFVCCVIGDFVIIFILVVDFGYICVGDVVQVVILLVDLFVWFVVIWCLVEIGGIDIGGQVFFIVVQLVGVDEMYFV